MSTRPQIIDVNKLNALRQQALSAWLDEKYLDVPEGWSISRFDPQELLRIFSPLRLQEDYKLIAYQFREGENGNGLILAVPEDQQEVMPPPPQLEKEANAPLPGQVMQHLRSDGSAESYAAASIFMRELREFGAFGHGVSWMNAQLLNDAMWKNGSELEPPLGSVPAGLHALNWHWEKRTENFDPYFEQEGETARVIFFALENPRAPVAVKYTDTYVIPGCAPAVQREVLARL